VSAAGRPAVTPLTLVRNAVAKAWILTCAGAIAACFLLFPNADSPAPITVTEPSTAREPSTATERFPAGEPIARTELVAGTEPIVDGVHVIGDSIAWRVHRRPLAPRHRPRGWTVDAFPGRRVTALGNSYGDPVDYPAQNSAEYQAATRHIFKVRHLWGRTVRTVVVALGTNGADTDLTVREATQLYAQGVRRLRTRPIWKPGRRVVLVTPWRASYIEEGAVNPYTGNPYPPSAWAEKSDVYTAAILRLARNTSGICVMRWDRAAARHPEWFRDGTHPNLEGQREWKRMAYRTVRRCHA